MKTPKQIAEDVYRECVLNYRPITELITEAIQADRKQRPRKNRAGSAHNPSRKREVEKMYGKGAYECGDSNCYLVHNVRQWG